MNRASDGGTGVSNQGNLTDNLAKFHLRRFAKGIDYALPSIYSS